MLGTPVQQKTKEIFDLFKSVEGFNYVYYGKIRNGKTYAATADILELLRRGEVVYANWKIDFETYDERNYFWIALIKLVAGKKYFFKFDSSNFHYIDTSKPDLIQHLNRLVGVHIFIDEGQWIFNSHLKTDDVDKRRLVLEGGHYFRSLNVITQRPQNILKDIRSQVHVWYQCKKVLHLGNIVRFVRYEIQDMVDDLPDEENYSTTKAYWGKSSVFQSYNTHGMRREDAIVEIPNFEVYQFNNMQKILLVFRLLTPAFVRRLAGRALAGRTPATKVRSFFTPEQKGKIFREVSQREKKNWKLKDITVKSAEADRPT